MSILGPKLMMFPLRLARSLLKYKDLKPGLNIVKPITTFDENQINSEVTSLEKTLNQVTLLGRVGGEPQRKGSAEHPVVIFSLATHTHYKYESGETSQKTDWHRISVFKPSLRDLVFSYLHKGQRILVSGRITYGSVKEDGKIRATASVVADEIIFFHSGENERTTEQY